MAGNSRPHAAALRNRGRRCHYPKEGVSELLTTADALALRAEEKGERWMDEPAGARRDVPSGTYRCTECGYELKLTYAQPQPPCPACRNTRYFAVDGRSSAANRGCGDRHAAREH